MSRGALVSAVLVLAAVAQPRAARAACTNGSLVDCNPPGSTLDAAAAFVDPAPPLGALQCAGFVNTAQDDVAWNWENNCIPFNRGELFLRVYDLGGTIIAGARLFDEQACPWEPDDLGYDTDLHEGEGLLGHTGVCNGDNATSFSWHDTPDSFCTCPAPDALGFRSCDDIFGANASNTAVLYVGANATSHAYEAVYGPPGGKNTCLLDTTVEIHELMIGIYVLEPDADADGILNGVDNCPGDANPAQDDADLDGAGDACDPCPVDPLDDADGDGLCAQLDNCPSDANPLQQDGDLDGLGDACDPCPGDTGNDPDEDRLCAAVDNCPLVYNPAQIDQDRDGVGAVCDVCPLDPEDDADGDLLCADADNCPQHANPGQQDGDGDGVGDACDACPAADDRVADGDGDGVCAGADNCPELANPGQQDADGDGAGDACDPCPGDPADDADGDGICGDQDDCPLDADPDQTDADGNGIGDACEPVAGSTGTGETGPGGEASGPSGDAEPPADGSTGGVGESSTGRASATGSGSDGRPGAEPSAGGCAQGSRGRGSAWWLALAALGFRERRRRGRDSSSP